MKPKGEKQNTNAPKTPSSVVDINDWRKEASNGKASASVVLRKQFSSDIEVVDDRLVKFVITTGEADRENDVIDPSGWDLSSYLKNPVVMFAHDYGSLPIARTVSLESEGDKLIASAEFASKELNPMAEQVFQMLKQGFLKGASVGFRPKTFQYNEKRGGVDFAQQELLEFSIVPIPANAQALMAAGLPSADMDLLKSWAENILLVAKSADALGIKGVSPTNVSTETAPMDTPWKRPSLGDFVDVPWEELASSKKRRIAGHFAWATARVPDNFGDMKLPHHRADDGYVIWRGVVAAAGRLNQTDFPSADMPAVKKHLANHFKEFDREAPWLRNELGWNAFIKSRDKALLKYEALSDGDIAKLFDDYGFTDEAATLMTVVKDEEAEAQPSTPDETVSSFVGGVTERLDRIEQLLSSGSESEPVDSLHGVEEMVLEVSDEDVTKNVGTFDEKNLSEVINEALRETINSVVLSETRTAINAMRGRIS
jgi:HK97 family phage prohead protease